MRAMRWWDIEAVMRIERAVFPDDAWTTTMFWSELAQRDSRFYLVEEGSDGDLVGYAGLCAYPPHEAYVQTIAVAGPAQGRGRGAALLVALIEEATRRGAVHLDLEVRADNEVAQRLYRAHEFTAIATRRGYYQPGGIDAVVMRRELAAA
ncbi:MAG TPA: ribosomal protein S18-alanine N-acetyltransferase [Mycobacteriales bacterium]|nr:ribosomal protein S18-alanine N-acetyltransferase [Mycobacteriales bacterium]